MPFPADLPPHDEYADIFDADDWNINIDGRMADFADEGNTVLTEQHTGHDVEFPIAREA